MTEWYRTLQNHKYLLFIRPFAVATKQPYLTMSVDNDTSAQNMDAIKTKGTIILDGTNTVNLYKT